MSLPSQLTGLRLPAIAAPMFLTSGPDLVVETCRSGVLDSGRMPVRRTTSAKSAGARDFRSARFTATSQIVTALT